MPVHVYRLKRGPFHTAGLPAHGEFMGLNSHWILMSCLTYKTKRRKWGQGGGGQRRGGGAERRGGGGGGGEAGGIALELENFTTRG